LLNEIIFLFAFQEKLCLEAGMDQFLIKPIHPENLLFAIAKAMGI